MFLRCFGAFSAVGNAAPAHLFENLPIEFLEEGLMRCKEVAEPHNVLRAPFERLFLHESLGLVHGTREMAPDGAEELGELVEGDGSGSISISLQADS